MNFDVKVKCQKCRCCFILNAETFKDEGSLLCPNCKAKMPDTDYANLASGIKHLAAVTQKNADPFADNDGFSVSVEPPSQLR